MVAPAPAVPRTNTARILGSLVAGLVVWHAVHGIMTPRPEGLAPWWYAGPMALALVAVGMIWARPPRWTAAALVLVAAVLGQAFVAFGDSPFARGVGLAVLAAFAVYCVWVYAILPLFAWQRGRWPVAPIPLEKFTPDPQWPTSLQRRLHALAELGFDARLMHARTEGQASAVVVLLVHPARAALGKVAHFAFGDRVHASTSLAEIAARPLAQGTSVVVTDTPPADVFPPLPEERVLLFPNAATATLLRHFDTLVPRNAKRRPLSDGDLLARWAAHMQRHDRFLVDQGYLSPDIEEGTRRYTMKGSYLTSWRSLWPWTAREHARQLREAQVAVRAASARGAA